MNKRPKPVYEFGEFRLIPAERVFLRGRSPVTLAPKAFDILAVLVENAGELVEKQDLMDRVWPNSYVEEANIQVYISVIRRTLGQPGLIETVPKKGYRFTGEVGLIEAEHTNGRISVAADDSSEPTNKIGKSLFPKPTRPSRPLFAGFSLLVILAASIGYVVFNRPKEQLPENFRNVNISKLTDSGKVNDAVISPDGTNLVYQLQENGSWTLWLRNLPTGAEKQILEPSVKGFENLVFSPDGQMIYFTQFEDRLDNINRVPIAGGSPQKLFDDIFGRISFSPDGERFAFTRANEEAVEYSLVTAKNDGTDVRVVAASKVEEGLFYWPAWSPDGKSMVLFKGLWHDWDRYGNRYCLVVVDAATGAERRLGSTAWQSIDYITWLRNGSGVIFAASDRPSTPRQIWFVDAKSGEARRITNDTNSYSGVSVDDQTQSIVAVQNDARSAIWWNERPGDFESFKLISAGPTALEGIYGLTLSHTKPQIALTARTNGNWDIWVMNLDGSDRRKLTSNDFYDTEPQITPDGQKIVFVSHEEQVPRHLWTMNLDGSEKTQLTNGFIDTFPAVSADSKWVFYVAYQDFQTNNLDRISIEGGDPVAIPNKLTVGSRIAVSPDGKYIAFATLDQNLGKHQYKLAVIPFDGGNPVKTFELPPNFIPNSLDIKWRPDGTTITVKTAGGAGWNLWDISVDGSQKTKLTNFNSGRIYAFDWSADNKHLAIARGDDVTDVVMIKDRL